MWIPSCCPLQLQTAHAEEGLRAARRFALSLARASSSQRPQAPQCSFNDDRTRLDRRLYLYFVRLRKNLIGCWPRAERGARESARRRDEHEAQPRRAWAPCSSRSRVSHSRMSMSHADARTYMHHA